MPEPPGSTWKRLSTHDLAKSTGGYLSWRCAGTTCSYVPPVPRSCSVLAPLDGTSDEQKAGAAMFANIEYCYEMQTMMRFRDPVLRIILAKMREPHGRKLTNDEWEALRNTELDDVSFLMPTLLAFCQGLRRLNARGD